VSGAGLLLAVFALSALACGLLGAPLIAGLRALSYRQQAYEDAPTTHQAKSGTPTMGGLLFAVALAVALFFRHDGAALALIVLVFGCGLVGFVDDYAAIRRGRNRGLRARTKFLATALVAVIFLGLLMPDPGFAARDVIFAFDGQRLTVSHWLWYALSLLVILATTHAVNLTDGLDGLAAGSVLPPLAVMSWIATRSAVPGAAVVDLAVAGASVGFLWYNRHPARIFMGDTGSLALGAALAGSAILTGTQLLLPLIGGVFAAEAVSVILQVAFFKTTRRRIFRMSPLHHHFELGGWPETKVTRRFWTASALLALAGVVIAR
jgi:phospho-N-acetylmuramoyl-pentapeptide-transferase